MRTYIKTLLLFFFFTLSMSGAYAISGESLLLLSYCKSPTSCGSMAQEGFNFIKLQCEATVRAEKCDQLAQKNPELAPLIQKCDTQSLCRQNEAYVEQKNLACYRGYVNAAIDMGVSLRDMAFGLAYQIGKGYDAAIEKNKDREKEIANCKLSCKRNLIKDNARYKNLTDEQLEKISAKVLYLFRDEQNYLNKTQARQAYNPNSAEELRARTMGEENSRQLDPDSERKKDVLVAMLKNKLKSEYNKYLCYNPLAREELECYALGGVIDPLALSGYFLKASRAMSALRATKNLDEVSALATASQRADDTVRIANAKKRSPLTAAEMPELTKILKASPPRTITNLPESLKLDKVERIDGSSYLQYSFAEKLPDGTWVRSQKELPIDKLTGAINANFVGGREFFEKMALAKAGRSHLAFIDVGSLGAVNKTFKAGTEAGDRYLKAVAEEIIKNGEGKVTLARLGGDEFGLIIDSADPKKVKSILENIQNSIRKKLDGDAHQVFRDEKIARADKYREEAKKLAAQNPDGKLTAENKAALRQDIDELAKIQQPDVSIGSTQIGQGEDLNDLLFRSESQAKDMKIQTTLNFGRSAEKYGSSAIPNSRPSPMFQAPVSTSSNTSTWTVSGKSESESLDLGSLRSMRVVRKEEVSRVGTMTLARYEDELGRTTYRAEKFLKDGPGGEKRKISTEIPTRGSTGLLDGMHSESQKMVLEHLKTNRDAVLIMPKLTGLRYLNYFESGTKAGDDMLEAVSKSIKSSLRADDLTFKLNGADFLMSVKKTNPAAVEKITEKLNADILKSPEVKVIIDRERSAISAKIQAAQKSGDKAAVEKLNQKMNDLKNYSPGLKFETLSSEEIGSKSFDDILKNFDQKFADHSQRKN